MPAAAAVLAGVALSATWNGEVVDERGDPWRSDFAPGPVLNGEKPEVRSRDESPS